MISSTKACIPLLRTFGRLKYLSSIKIYSLNSSRLVRSLTTERLPAVSEQEARVKLKLTPGLTKQELDKLADTFGNYESEVTEFDRTPDDPDDVEALENARQRNRLTIPQYASMLKTHLKNHEYETARDLLENRILKVDKIKPCGYLFNILINYCCQTGDLKEAFRLYTKQKRIGIKVHGSAYTALFDGCANCANSRYALKIAGKLREKLKQLDTLHPASVTNYNAMLKAFGRHGDLKTCFSIVDEIIQNRGKIRDDTYNFLIQSCITDRNSGFRHALLVWHKLLQNKTRPSIYTFNLMLRSVRDCCFGEIELIPKFINGILSESNTRELGKLSVPFHKRTKKQKELTDGGVIDEAQPVESEVKSETPNLVPISANTDTKSEVLEQAMDKEYALFATDSPVPCLSNEKDLKLPNLLALKPTSGNVLSLSSIVTPYHRLLFMGGTVGFLNTMQQFAVEPDAKTYTLLLEIIPSTLEDENMLLSMAEDKKVQLDTVFCNVLIKRRCMRDNYDSAKAVLQLMSDWRMKPDLITFGVVALTCKSIDEAKNFIDDMKDAGYRPNAEILGTLLKSACVRRDFEYVNFVLKVAKEEEVKPNSKFYSHLDRFVNKEKRILRSYTEQKAKET